MSYTNKEVASLFRELGKLMEIHGESPFKTRAYENAYRTIRAIPEPVIEKNAAELQKIPGIGKAIADKTVELADTGRISALEKYRDKTPPGVRDMLDIKGLGPKKIKQIWAALGIESVGELLYACNENRLVSLNGVGLKTQTDILAKSKYYLQSRDKLHYAKALPIANELLSLLCKKAHNARIEITGELRREMPVVSSLDFMGTADGINFNDVFDNWGFSEEGNCFIGYFESVKCTYHFVEESEWGRMSVHLSSAPEFLDKLEEEYGPLPAGGDEQDIFTSMGYPYIIPQRREVVLMDYVEIMTSEAIVQPSDIKGIIHAHSTYSDGSASLKAMAEECRQLGYEYLGITDHSKAAFYADGLEEARVKQQWTEIDALNSEFNDFTIFKGIEADILSDGTLDYDPEFLKGFDFVIASIHSNLKMDKDKATNRLIKAIEQPATTILGHPTGRLLLSREGYPIDHKKVIDAAASNGVAIEINANPYRLDLDWLWVPYALNKGVKLSINPDAHSLEGIKDINWGIPIANKGGADVADLLCCMDVLNFKSYIDHKS